MLEAKKSAWFEKVFAVYIRNLLKRRFNSLRVSGLKSFTDRKSNLPLLIYVNHSSWWDGLVAFQISRTAKLNSYFMMEEKQLRNLQLFRKLGAFSVVRDKPRQAMKSINYAAEILKENSNNAVWIFPQGEILPNDTRPLFFYKGLNKIIEKAEICNVLPMAIRYEFIGDFKPDIFVKIGELEIFGIDALTKDNLRKYNYEHKLTLVLDSLKKEILNLDYQHFERII